MFEPGHCVGVAVSGGADSMCLLHVLLELAPRWNLALRVLHLDHSLRGAESRADAAFVAAAADRLRLPFELETARLTEGNLEQQGRRARLAFFRRVMREGRADRVAVGHTLSDQAETVLFRLLRGAASAGLAGIRPITSEGIIRPLFDVERADVLAFLAHHGISWREDASNQSRAFARNRIRHDLLPSLTRDWNPSLAKTLAQTAEWARAEEEWWAEEVSRLATRYLTLGQYGTLVRASDLSALPTAAARRLIRHAIAAAKGDLNAIGFDHVERVLHLARGRDGEGCVTGPGFAAQRSFDWLRFANSLGGSWEDYLVPLSVPGSISVRGGTLYTEVIENQASEQGLESRYNGFVSCLDWNRIEGPLHLRNWRAGDRYQPVGCAGEEKVKILFQQARVPIWERQGWPVIVSGGEIVWARKFGPAARFVSAASGSKLLIHDRSL